MPLEKHAYSKKNFTFTSVYTVSLIVEHYVSLFNNAFSTQKIM